MKRFWITVGTALTITAVIFVIAEIVSASRKDVLSQEVTEQLNTIYRSHESDRSFDSEALNDIYNNKDRFLEDRSHSR